MNIETNGQTTDYNGRGLDQNKTGGPRVLLIENSMWSVVALLAVRLANAGMEVSAVCPARHPLRKTCVVRQILPYSAIHPLESLSAAIQATRPDIIIPCDDRAVGHVHELHSHAVRMGAPGRNLGDLIEKSLGSPKSYPVVTSRYDLLRIAGEEGLRVPDTKQINSESDLKSWDGQAFPWVLKADTTGNGRGVRVAHSSDQAGRFLSELNRFYRLGRAIKRICVNRDPFWIRPWWQGVKPPVIVQSYIHGRPANCGVVCWKGKVLAAIGVEVVSETGAMAHSSVVRPVDNPDMMLCSERIAKRLNLSGFFGLDFMIENRTELTYLIEMNPRPTRLSSLRLGKGRDMIGALFSQLADQPAHEIAVTQKGTIAYFPEVPYNSSQLPESCYHDFPEGELDLMRELQRPWPTETLLWRLLTMTDTARTFVRKRFLKPGSVIPKWTPQQDSARLAQAKLKD